MLIAYAVCCAIELVLLPLDGAINWVEVGPGLVLQLGIGALLVVGPRLRWRFIGVVGVIGYLVSVALLRDGAEPTAGFGPLVLLPVVWASLRGGRNAFLTSIVGVAVLYLVPTVVIGPPHYPAGGWRAGLLFVVVSTVLGVAVVRLVNRVRELVNQLDKLARTDELTGLPNRRAWQELLDHELSIARRTGHPLTIAMFDLDHFKEFNDAQGHLAGDRRLIETTSAWCSTLREGDVLARWGGDEFSLLLPSCDSTQGRTIVDRLRSACPEVSFSAGLVQWDGRGLADSVVALADRALYSAKAAERSGGLEAGHAAESVVKALP